MGLFTVDSCHSRWVFDEERRRFRRVPKGPGFGVRMVLTEWRAYHDVHLDQYSDQFVVVLNEAGTRMLRSWRHTDVVCPHCGASKTEELSVSDIAHAEGD